ncbi:NifB/NifX family molybdenum-iron cluster-binding protein [Poriferisphaera sp. WC338]|uniref:NifB/NifX family molybdenum-iron cluster-binding protein n=1 Tax=Poriferisphaera sp. WC338 TaxID=3425129 RepID=UPI003D818455
MRIGIPMVDGALSQHFGQMDRLAVYEVSGGKVQSKQIYVRESAEGCHRLPRWIKSLGVQRVLVGGLGQGALNGLVGRGIEVGSAAGSSDEIDEVMATYLESGVVDEVRVCQGHGEGECNGEGHNH